MDPLGPVTPAIGALLYGPYPDLHKKFLDGLWLGKLHSLPVYLWLNVVGDKTRKLLESHPLHWRIFDSAEENLGKYKAMRILLDGARKDPDWNWWVWFDDDTPIVKADWLAKWKQFIDGRRDKNVCYIGTIRVKHFPPGFWDVVKAADWFKGRPPGHPLRKEGVDFARGAHWWLRRDVLETLDWPDRRLDHNYGDVLLGEAIHQLRLPVHKNDYGIKMDIMKRRGRTSGLPPVKL